MSDPGYTGGRGLVISGAIVIGLNLFVTIMVAAYLLSFDALVTMGVETGLAPVVIPMGLTVVIPSWFVGVPLLAIGRSRQRGPVKGAVWAWIVALAAVPVSLFLLLLVVDASLSAYSARTADPVPAWAANAAVALVPLAVVLAFAAVAWLVWGKPAQPAKSDGPQPLPTA